MLVQLNAPQTSRQLSQATMHYNGLKFGCKWAHMLCVLGKLSTLSTPCSPPVNLPANALLATDFLGRSQEQKKHLPSRSIYKTRAPITPVPLTRLISAPLLQSPAVLSNFINPMENNAKFLAYLLQQQSISRLQIVVAHRPTTSRCQP